MSFEQWFESIDGPKLGFGATELARAAWNAALAASEASAEPLVVWRSIAEEAEIVVYRSGKRLLLTEEMCIRLGTAIENTYAPRPADYAAIHLTPEQAAKEAV
ncbi:hypothetical protein [Caballeronia sp. NCTM1]|uniref:hypothetical protein n=1 Tax=Caballeronia sp. NCTM1 TaxID=2921753 RepID=UPI0020297BC0|nr:hypothetical protein [Caballeronia sp. NCTM1]